MSVHHVVRHSGPASVRLTFVSFINHYYFVTRGPLNPGGIVALHWFGEYVSSFFAIIPSCSRRTMWAKYPKNKLVRAVSD